MTIIIIGLVPESLLIPVFLSTENGIFKDILQKLSSKINRFDNKYVDIYYNGKNLI